MTTWVVEPVALQPVPQVLHDRGLAGGTGDQAGVHRVDGHQLGRQRDGGGTSAVGARVVGPVGAVLGAASGRTSARSSVATPGPYAEPREPRRPPRVVLRPVVPPGHLGHWPRAPVPVGNLAAPSPRSAYSGGVPLGPDPELARAAVARLDDLRATVTAAEDDVLACLVVTGEPRPQRVLDDWLDQVADTLRALGEQAADLSSALARHAAPPGALRGTATARMPWPATCRWTWRAGRERRAG